MTTTTVDEIKAILTTGFGAVDVAVVRPGRIFQVNIPLFHGDGDGVQVYVRREGGQLTVSDMGTTAMRLSYDGDVDVEGLSSLAEGQGLGWNEGAIEARVSADELVPAVLGLAQIECSAEAALRASSRRRRESSEDFREAVIEVVRSAFKHVEVGWHEPSDHLGDFSIDAIVHAAKPLAIMAFGSSQAGERAIGTKLQLASRELPVKKPLWVAIPKSAQRISATTMRRVGRHFHLPLVSFDDAQVLPEKLHELADAA